ncbi:hypothetical protein [Qipengyuania qiaonensis]|uniref:Cardiolipin synthase N-terminal domain-containing protein n=1 Tax=Qipengyuania qiaonensis TaxID=2867240 RepID=A0ABS7J926_9SPHN|nr:hypothetical protein [Qipengyuania qiaonensis]MBX7482569.1 hypothetical protein [Qipengyuania qiaonensis]
MGDLLIFGAVLFLGYSAGYFGKRPTVLPGWLRHLVALPLPIWLLLAVYLLDAQERDAGQQGDELIWFFVLLLMVSPGIICWVVGYLVGATRDNQVEPVV